MQRHILVYNDETTSNAMLQKELKRIFHSRSFQVNRIDIEDIRKGILRTPEAALLVLPGVAGEDSRYQRDFLKSELDEYQQFVERRGVSLNFCGGASLVSRVIDYKSRSREHHVISVNPLFNGRAAGPMNTDGLIAVRFKNQVGTWEDSKMHYAHGPVFIPDDPDDPALDILMTYPHLPGQPIAALRLQVGEGSVYLIGPHPENGPNEFRDDGSERFSALRALNAELQVHESARLRFLDMLTRRIQQDMDKKLAVEPRF